MLDKHLHSKLTESVDSLPFSTRTLGLLKRNGIQTVIDMLSLQRDDFLSIPGIGPVTMAEIQSVTYEYISVLGRDCSMPEVHEALRKIRQSRNSLPEQDNVLDDVRISVSRNDSITTLPLSIRSCNALRRSGIKSVDNLLSTPDYIIRMIKNVGEKTFREIQSVRKALQYLLPPEDTVSSSMVEQKETAKDRRSRRIICLDDRQVSISLNDSVETLPLSGYSRNALLQSGVRTVSDLLANPQYRIEDIRNVDEKLLRVIQAVRKSFQLHLPPETATDRLSEMKDKLPDSIAEKIIGFGITELVDLSQYTVEDLVIQTELIFLEVQRLAKILATAEIVLSTRWPEYPLVSSSDYQFLKRAGIPLDEISVSRLALPGALEAQLRRLGIETVGAVAIQSRAVLEKVLGGRSEEHINTLVKNLRTYFEWSLSKSDWEDEIAGQGISPLYYICLKETTLERIIDSLLRHVPRERDRKVIRFRFGLDGGGQRTLQQIADELGVSRERIRQIEKKAVDRTKLGKDAGLIQALYTSIEDEMRVRGGLMSVTQIGEHIVDLIDIGEIDLNGAVLLLLSLEPDPFVELQRKRRWGLKDTPQNLVKSVTQELVRILRAVHAPLPQADLIDHLTQTEWYAQLEDKDRLSSEFIIACLSTDDRFEETEDNQWGLTRWKKKRIDEIVMALRQLGKPSHFTEIAKITNEMLPPSQRTSARNILSQMRHNSHLFVWVNRGTYGLAEWGLKRVRFYVDIAEELLEQRGEPLTFEEIFSVINAKREASPSSIQFMLHTNPRFQQYPEGKFGLTSWSEEQDEEEEDITDDLFLEDLKRRLFDDF